MYMCTQIYFKLRLTEVVLKFRKNTLLPLHPYTTPQLLANIHIYICMYV